MAKSPLMPSQIEKRLFEIVSLMGSVVLAAHSTFQIFVAPVMVSVIIEYLLSGYCAFLFYNSYYKNSFEKGRISLVIIAIVFIIIYWPVFGGYYGTAGITIVPVAIITIFLTPEKYNKLGFIIVCLLLIGLTAAQQFTDNIRQEEFDYSWYGLQYFIFTLPLFIILYFLKNTLDKERTTIQEQNLDLKALSSELTDNLIQKEKAIEKLERTQGQLLESAKMAAIGQITNGIAHKLNNPLNFVGGMVSPLRRDIEEVRESISKLNPDRTTLENLAEIERLLNDIDSGTKRAMNVVKELSGVMPSSFEESETNISLQEVVENVILVMGENGNVKYKVDINKEHTLKTNVADLHQVILNVVRNAVEAVADMGKGVVEITSSRDTNRLTLTIQDNGNGIDQGNIQHVFNAFYSSKKESHSGLGLFMAESMMKKNHHSIEIESEANKYTKVILNFRI